MLDFSCLEQQIKQEMATGDVPGLALAVVRGQEVIYAHGFGVTGVEEGGAISSFSSHLMLLPQEGIGAILLNNRADGFRTPGILNRILSAP